MMTNKNGDGVSVKLTLREAYQILAIDLDEDHQQALWFIQEKMARKIHRCLQPSCALPWLGQSSRRCKPECRDSREICCISGRRRQASPGLGLVQATEG